MQIHHELLKDAMDGRLFMGGRLVGHPGSSRLRGEPGPSVAGRGPARISAATPETAKVPALEL